MNKQIKLKYIIYPLLLILAIYVLFYSDYSYKYVKGQNKSLTTQIDSIAKVTDNLLLDIEFNNELLKEKDSIIKESENRYQRIEWSLNKLRKDYKNEIQNPIHNTVNEQYDYLLSKYE